MTVGMAFVQECVCGYQKRDPSNWSKHRKACRALRVIEPLQRENERLRTLQQDATERAVQALQEQYSKLAAKVERLEEQQRAIVPAQQTTIHNQTVNNTININIYPYESTPVPPRRNVIPVFSNPPAAIPMYFGKKHLEGPKTRNLKIVDGKMSIYTKDRTSGIVKWVERDKRAMLATIVSDIIFDLYEEHALPKNKEWQGWRQSIRLDAKFDVETNGMVYSSSNSSLGHVLGPLTAKMNVFCPTGSCN